MIRSASRRSVVLWAALCLGPSAVAMPATAQEPDAPSTETPATEAPSTETPPNETPATETPATEAPPSEVPVAEVEAAVVAPTSATPPDAAPAVPAGYEAGATLAVPEPPQPVDDERPPGFVATPVEEPRVAHEPSPERDLPIRPASRPLTLTAGTMRFDHSVLIKLGSTFIAQMAFRAMLGVTDDLEVGLEWPIGRDPTLLATGRLFSNGTIDVGVRGALQVPIVTEGNTDARVGVPLVVRGGPVRFMAAADLDVLFTANVSTILSLQSQFIVSAGRAFSFGAQGWLGLLDGRHAVGDVQGLITFTAWAAGRPVLDVRFAAGYAPSEGDVIVNHSVTLYPQLF